MHWLVAQFGVCRSMQLIDNSLNMVQSVSGFHSQICVDSVYIHVDSAFYL